MASGTRIGSAVFVAAVALFAASLAAVQPNQRTGSSLPDVDVRDSRPPAAPTDAALEEMRGAPQGDKSRRVRTHPHTGAIRILDVPGLSVALERGRAQRALPAFARRLGLAPDDLAALNELRDYVSASTGLRHLVFAQTADGIPVWNAVVSIHVAPDGNIVRLTSSGASLARRRLDVVITAGQAAAIAVHDVRPGALFSPAAIGGTGGSTRATVFERGPFAREVSASLTWFALDGGVRLAWHVVVEPDAATESYDVLVDAETGERLLRRNRVRYADGLGRVLQSATTIDPRLPDARPVGDGGCPPVVNYDVRSLTAPFRDSATVLFDTGQLAGNNTRVYRRVDGAAAATGTLDGGAWRFDFPFNSAGSAETALFFALNYAHDFFYDLGFDEAAGNYQVDNFGRGGVGGDSVKGLARASGRNNATFMPAPEGSSPTISMFLFDAAGCWGADTDGDGSLDLDGDYDFDIIVHEFGHGVSLRLNTAFEGAEADAMGEGFSDFFSYSITNETTLAEYVWPGGIRGINGKTYANWTCLLGIFCEPHDNGEIWVNALWDVRERLRRDLVRGSEAAAINEAHQLAVDALKISPPSPTMLDMRDALLLADSLRNPGTPDSQNFCRIWEPFAARGMGLNATDTADNGFNQVSADYSVPSPCEPPPPPPTVTITVIAATATEAGPTNGTFIISRGTPRDTPLNVNYFVGGSATRGVDYQTIAAPATIPAGAAQVSITIVPIDDTLLEANETVVISLSAASSYVLGSPASGTVTLVSDDVAPDLVLSALTGPLSAASGGTIQVSDTTKNQGTGPSGVSETRFYLSKDLFFDANDTPIGSRAVGELAVGATSAGTTSVALPAGLPAGQYTLIAKADGPNAIAETQESNNLRSMSVRIGPDLTVTALTVPATAGAGASITLSDTTTNAGGATAEASTTRFYLSANTLWDAADVPLDGRSVPSVAPSGVSSAQTAVTIPSGTAAAMYYIIARADAAEVVPEVFETNNIRAAAIRIGPDLTVSALSAPSAAAGAGMAITVSDTTTNSGAGAAGSSTTRFYLSANFTLEDTDVVLGSRTVPGLQGGVSSPTTTPLTLPPGLATGSYYLIAKADAANEIAETTETNNTRYVIINVGPDLVVSFVSAPARAESAANVVLSDTTRNSGGGAAPPTTTAWYLSTNFSLDATDVRLAEHTVGALDAGVSVSTTVNVTLPELAPGVWYVLAVADDPKVLAETSEANNTRFTSITIGPDLFFSMVSLPSSFAAGSTISVSEAVYNQGTAAPASRTRFYLSLNNVLDSGDIPLAQFRDVPPLAQRAAHAGTTSLTIPAGLSGSYYLLFVADADSVITEANEANNVTPRLVQITK